MSTLIQQHPASIDAYIRHGWSLISIPPGTKGPRTPNWQKPENALKSSADLPPGYGIGLAHGYSGTMALDIDDWATAATALQLVGVDLNALYQAPDAVVISSGRESQGHGKLLYAMPEGLVLRSRKLSTIVNNRPHNYLDFRCSTSDGLTVQDCLPPTTHPDTQQPYRWAGLGNWQRLPTIPAPLLEFWQSLLTKDTERVIASSDAVNTSWSEIIDALTHIDPSCDRDKWIHVGMALHYAGTATDSLDTALSAWNDWSAQSDKYPGPDGLMTQWRAFKAGKDHIRTLGSLFHYAGEAGWTRKLPDASVLFSSTAPLEGRRRLLENLKPAPPGIDTRLFPDLLRRRADEIASGMGLDPLIPLSAGLATLSGAADARTRLELMPGWKVPPVLWVMTIGEPGDKKTPGSDPLFGPLDALEHEAIPKYNDEYLRFEAKEAAYSAAKKAYLDQAASPEYLMGGDLPPLPEKPMPPRPYRLKFSDITSQKVVRDAEGNPQGMLCALDEMSNWCKKLADKQSIENRGCWIAGYESKSYRYSRVGAGDIFCENLAFAMYGNVQPRVLTEYSEVLASDGMLQRFIPFIVRSDKARRGDPVPECLTSAAEWESQIRLIHSLPPITYSLSPEAYARFREWQLHYESSKYDERITGGDYRFLTAYSKLEGTVGRLALVFHLIDDPFNQQVSLETLNRVLFFTESYMIPVLRYAHSDSSDSMESWVIEHVMHHCDEQSFTLTDLRRSGHRQLSKRKLSGVAANQALIAGMFRLERAEWVARIDDGSREHQGFAQWVVNPQVLEQFGEDRLKVLKARQRKLDNCYLGAEQYEKFKGRRFIAGYDPVTMDDPNEEHPMSAEELAEHRAQMGGG